MRKLLIITVCMLCFIFCGIKLLYKPQIKTIKVGIIDGAISSDNISRYGITDFLTLTHEENITSTHGEMILDIICNRCSNIEIYYVDALGNNNQSDISNICKALRYLEEKDVDIINMSLMTLTHNNELENYVKRLIDSGITIIAACLNYSNITCYPANYDGVISISNVSNSNASIVFTPEEKRKISKEIGYHPSTSALTAYYTSIRISKLQK